MSQGLVLWQDAVLAVSRFLVILLECNLFVTVRGMPQDGQRYIHIVCEQH